MGVVSLLGHDWRALRFGVATNQRRLGTRSPVVLARVSLYGSRFRMSV